MDQLQLNLLKAELQENVDRARRLRPLLAEDVERFLDAFAKN